LDRTFFAFSANATDQAKLQQSQQPTTAIRTNTTTATIAAATKSRRSQKN